MNMFKAFENVMAGTPIATVSDDNQKIRIVKGYGKKKNGVEQQDRGLSSQEHEYPWFSRWAAIPDIRKWRCVHNTSYR
jgi:hypothetical protein